MAFDLDGARSAGYSDAEIASFLGSQFRFDVDGAIKAGYAPSEIVGFLSGKDAARKELPKGVEPSDAGAGRGNINPPTPREKAIAEMDEVTDPTNPNYSPLTSNAQEAIRADARQQMDAKRTRTPGRVLDADVPGITAGSAARDVAAGALQIGPTALKGVGDIARLATADRFGKGVTEFAEGGNKAIQDVVGSDRAASQRKRFEQDMADPAMNPADVIVGNPGALSDMALPTLGSMALPIGAAAGADKLARAGNAAKLAAAIDPATVAARAATASGATVIGTVAVQNAADTYGNIIDKGGSQEEAYRGAAIAAGAAVLASKATGGGAEGAIARAITGKGMGAAAARGAVEVPKAAFKEAVQEMGEQVGSSLGEVSGTGEEFDPNRFGKELAVSGALGGMIGGGVNAAGQIPDAARTFAESVPVNRNPVPDILKAPDIDSAIDAADAAVQTPAPAVEAVDNIERILAPTEPAAPIVSEEAAAAVERAASLETPTAMQLALEKANVAPAPVNEAAPVEAVEPVAEPIIEPIAEPVAEPTPELPRIVERTPEMVSLPQKLAEQRAAANPEVEVVRIVNQSGNIAYTLIPKAADDIPSDVPALVAGTDGSGSALGSPVLDAGVGAVDATGPALDSGRAGNQSVGEPLSLGAASTEPVATWFGRRGDGYVTTQDAQMAIPSRERVSPDLTWTVEQMPSGKYRLAGYDSAAVKSGDAQVANSPSSASVPVSADVAGQARLGEVSGVSGQSESAGQSQVAVGQRSDTAALTNVETQTQGAQLPAGNGSPVQSVLPTGVADAATGQRDGSGRQADIQSAEAVPAAAQVTQTPPQSGVSNGDPIQQRERLNGDDLVGKSFDELDSMHQQAREHNRAVDLEAIRKFWGESQAKEAQGWTTRKREKWLTENETDEASDWMQTRYINDELISEHRSAVNDFDTEGPLELGRSIAVRAKDVDKPGFFSTPDGVAFSNALRYAKEQGWDLDQVMGGMRERSGEWAGSNAPELFSRLFQKATGEAPQAAARALPPLTERQRIEAMPRRAAEKRDKLTPNPLKTFLIRNGVALRLAREFAPGTRERLSMGRTFRNGGMELDALAERAAEAGYIRDRMDTDELYSLITKVANGERVAPMYGQDAEAELSARVDRQRQAEQDAAEDVAELSDASLLALDDDSDIPWDSPVSTTTEQFLRAMGASEQEIENEVANEQRRAQEGAQGRVQPVEAGPREAQADRGRRGEAARAEEGLSRPTPADVIAQQDRSAEAPARDERAQIDREAEAQTLTAQDAPEQRSDNSGDMFAREKAEAEIDKRNAGTAETDDGISAKLFTRDTKPVMASRKDVVGQAKAMGLPATGTTDSIANMVRIAQADPRTWSREDFDLIKSHLSVHQVFRDGAYDKIMESGTLDAGMVDNLGNLDTREYRTAASKLTHPAVVLVTGALKNKGPGNPHLAPGNKVLFGIREPGDSIFDAIKASAELPNESTAPNSDGAILKTESQGRPFTEYRKLKGQHGIDFARNDAERILGFKSPVRVVKKADQALADQRVPMYYDLDEKVIVYNSAYKNRSRAQDAEWMAEEILHAVDHVGGTSTISLGSDTLKEGGELRAEVESAMERSGAIRSFLSYPLRTPGITDDRKTVELFARLGVIFHGFPDLLRAAAPKTYEAFREIFNTAVQRDVRGTDPAVAVQAAGGRSEVGRGGSEAGAGNQVGRADQGLESLRGRIAGAIGSSTEGSVGDFGSSRLETRAEVAEPENPRLSPWKDELGRVQFAPGAWLESKIGQAATPLLNKLLLKAASPELRKALREMKIQIAKAQETAAAVAVETNKLSAAERELVSDIIEREVAAGTVPPEHAVRLAATINATFEAQTNELVRLGMLTQDSADRWRGQYLPRFYESKLTRNAGDLWANSMRGLTRKGAMQGIKGKHLKGRGLYETIPENELAQYEAMGWEVRDHDYQPGLTGDGTVQVWRDFTRQERDSMGEIRDAGFRFVMGYMQTQKDIALGRMFEQLAVNPDMSSRLQSDKFTVQVPDTKVEGTGAKRYGKLAGRYVSSETLSQLSVTDEMQNELLQLYRQALSKWKEGKTVLNPVSHVNNMVSNLTMAHFAGVSYHRGDKYLAAMRDFATKSAGIKEAKDAGLFLGTLSEAELMNTLPTELKVLAMRQESTTGKVGRHAFNLLSFYLRKPMGWAYQAEDTFFRYLIYKEARSRGLEPNEAVDYAQKYIFTYDDLPKGARRVRDFGIPFFAYTYKAVPALLHTALTHPDRFAAPAAILWIANAMAYAIAAGDDDDSWEEKLKKYATDPAYRAKAREQEQAEREHIPPWLKGTSALGTPKAVRLGMDEVTKLPLFIDVSRIIPGGDMFDVNPNAGGVGWIPQPLTPSNPLFTTAVAMLANKDLWLGKDLTDNNDTSGEKFEKRAAWMWRQFTPAVAVNNYHWNRAMNAIAQATGKDLTYVPDVIGGDATGIGRDGLPVQPGMAAAQTFGIKVRPIDLDKAEEIGASMKNKTIREIDAEMRSLRRLNNLGALNDRAYDKALELADKKKDRIREGMTVDGDEKN
jgi:hypothetical protein